MSKKDDTFPVELLFSHMTDRFDRTDSKIDAYHKESVEFRVKQSNFNGRIIGASVILSVMFGGLASYLVILFKT